MNSIELQQAEVTKKLDFLTSEYSKAQNVLENLGDVIAEYKIALEKIELIKVMQQLTEDLPNITWVFGCRSHYVTIDRVTARCFYVSKCNVVKAVMIDDGKYSLRVLSNIQEALDMYDSPVKHSGWLAATKAELEKMLSVTFEPRILTNVSGAYEEKEPFGKRCTMHTLFYPSTFGALQSMLVQYPNLKIYAKSNNDGYKFVEASYTGILNAVDLKRQHIKLTINEQCTFNFSELESIRVIDQRVFNLMSGKTVLMYHTNKHLEGQLVPNTTDLRQTILNLENVENVELNLVIQFQYYELDTTLKHLLKKPNLIVGDLRGRVAFNVDFNTFQPNFYVTCTANLVATITKNLTDIGDPIIEDLKKLSGRVVTVKTSDGQQYLGYKLTLSSSSHSNINVQCKLEGTSVVELGSCEILEVCEYVPTQHADFQPTNPFIVEMYRSRGLVKLDLENYDQLLSATIDQGKYWKHLFDHNSTPMSCLVWWAKAVDAINQGELPVLRTVIGLPSHPDKDCYASECLYAIYNLVLILLKYSKNAKIGAEFKALWEDCFDKLIIRYLGFKPDDRLVHLNTGVLNPVLARVSDVQWLLRIFLCYPRCFRFTSEMTHIVPAEIGRDALAFLKKICRPNFSVYHEYFYVQLDQFFEMINTEKTQCTSTAIRQRIRNMLARKIKLGEDDKTQKYWTHSFLQLAAETAVAESQLQHDACWMFETSIAAGNTFDIEICIGTIFDENSTLTEIFKTRMLHKLFQALNMNKWNFRVLMERIKSTGLFYSTAENDKIFAIFFKPEHQV
jgi:hypothetical protein